MSVAELRASIAKLSAEIDLQKTRLKKLETDRSLAHRQLNAVLDPVERLPVEISSEIFLQSLPSFPSAGAEPVLRLDICHAWTEIAVSTPSLWAAIRVTFSPTPSPGFKEGLQAWLQRACNHPLSISICGPGYFDQGATDIIWRYGQQLQHLELCYQNEEEEEEDIDEETSGWTATIDLLGGNPGLLPLLRTLAIRGLSTMPHRVGYSGIQIMDLLRRAPNLVECTFDNVHPVNDLDGEILILPSLRRVCFGVPGELPNSDETILLCISLTQLDILLVPLRDTTPEGFFSFLKRSSPPLQELVMDAELLSFEVLSAFFSLIPTLEHLELWRTELQVLDEIFTALADSPSFLPNVHTLKIIRPGSSEDHFNSWKTLSRALSSCRLTRPQLRSVRIEPRVTLTCYVFLKLEPAILASFRDLVAGGMELYIGTAADGHNFVFD